MQETASSDPLARLQEERPAPGRRSYRARSLGLLLAWLGAVACGWRVYAGSDLLNAVARGAAAWIGFLLVWMAGVIAYERLVLSGRETGSRHSTSDGAGE